MSIEELVAEVLYIDLSLVDDNSGPETIEAWDSLGHINIITAIEEEFDIEISPDEIAEITTVNDIKKILSTKHINLD
jgi:acyl carrier protein